MSRILYLTNRSPYARKVRILFQEKALAFQPQLVDLQKRSDEFVAVSPLGKVPVLVDDDGTVVFDSTVIAEYLEDRYPEPSFFGRTWRDRLLCREGEELGDTISDHAVAAWQANDRKETAVAERSYGYVEKALREIDRRRSSGLWPMGFTIADISVLSGIEYFELRHGRARLDPHAGMLAWLDAFRSRSSVRESVPRL